MPGQPAVAACPPRRQESEFAVAQRLSAAVHWIVALKRMGVDHGLPDAQLDGLLDHDCAFSYLEPPCTSWH